MQLSFFSSIEKSGRLFYFNSSKEETETERQRQAEMEIVNERQRQTEAEKAKNIIGLKNVPRTFSPVADPLVSGVKEVSCLTESLEIRTGKIMLFADFMQQNRTTSIF